jgi:hypothetical protein
MKKQSWDWWIVLWWSSRFNELNSAVHIQIGKMKLVLTSLFQNTYVGGPVVGFINSKRTNGSSDEKIPTFFGVCNLIKVEVYFTLGKIYKAKIFLAAAKKDLLNLPALLEDRCRQSKFPA